MVRSIQRVCSRDTDKALAENVQYPRADGRTNRAIANPSGGQPLHGPEMLQRRPVYDEWDDTEFLPLRMRDLPPKPAPPPSTVPPGPQRYASQVPVVWQQHLRNEPNPHPRNSFTPAPDASRPSSEIIRTGRETYAIVSTLQEAEPEDGGMSQGVYVVSAKEEKVFVAKRLSTASESKRARAKAEMQALQQVKSSLRRPHDNVNSLREAFLPENAPQGVLILDYCEAGSLAAGVDALKARNGAIGEDLAFHLLYGIAKGLAMIHHGVPDHTKMQNRVEKWEYHLPSRHQTRQHPPRPHIHTRQRHSHLPTRRNRRLRLLRNFLRHPQQPRKQDRSRIRNTWLVSTGRPSARLQQRLRTVRQGNGYLAGWGRDTVHVFAAVSARHGEDGDAGGEEVWA